MKLFFKDINHHHILLAGAFAIYGLWGKPAPQEFTWVEGTLIIFFILGLGLNQCLAFGFFNLEKSYSIAKEQIAGTAAFLWFMTIPLLQGLIQNWSLEDIIRDLGPSLFLFIPLLWPQRNQKDRSVLIGGILWIGLCFTFRWYSTSGLSWEKFPHFTHVAEGTGYLLNSPSVLFTGTYLPLRGLEKWEKRPDIASFIKLGVFGSMGFFCLLPLVLTTHRAAVGITAIVFLIALGRLGSKRPSLAFALAISVGLILIVLWQPLSHAMTHIVEKTRIVGDNARLAETAAVLHQLGPSWVNLMVGQGWGTLISNPAVGEWRVSYTHFFPTYILLKTGLIGFILIGIYITFLLRHLRTLWTHDFIVFLSLAGPLSIGFFLHTSFKYLCFGFILSLLEYRQSIVFKNTDLSQYL